MKTTVSAILTAVLLTLPPCLRASSFQDSLKLNMEKAPALYSSLIASLDFKEREWENVRCIPIDSSDPSKGYRAMWMFEARSKGEKDGYPLRAQFSFITYFFDAKGSPCDLTSGERVERSFESVTLIENNK